MHCRTPYGRGHQGRRPAGPGPRQRMARPCRGLGGAAIRGLPPDTQGEADEELLDYAAAHPGLMLTGYGTLMAGAYSRTDGPPPERYDHPGPVARLRVPAEVAAECGATVNQVVPAWLMGGAVPGVPVVGVSSVAQLDECLAALDLRQDAVQRARLDTA
ncbi:hypothetical protein Sgleb_68090 [Streptomyces glebosus]|uniref:NADP-dependent oxidoreductase domain-containing protein n=2 Tax=Streptomyces glebosus TaxID=249580 RepID=A0A640T6W4_9ACTN|nr:hypothetical protein Sgleb_68090 [Streptomyces glebosus]GHG49748.1 hypothetical protein GCM10010513_07930 [Streptomyces glebosus]